VELKISHAKVNIVILRNIKEKKIWSHLQARIDEKGNLLIEGQDMGSSVGEIFDDELYEYEYVTTIKQKDISLLIAAFNGNRDDSILVLIKEKCTGENSINLEKLIKDKDIPNQVWNWSSD
jgi:hypothetical protein